MEVNQRSSLSFLSLRIASIKEKKKSLISTKQKMSEAPLQFLGDRTGTGNEKVSYKDHKSTTFIIVVQHQWLIKRNVCSHAGHIQHPLYEPL